MLGGASGCAGFSMLRKLSGGGGSWRWKKGGEDVVAVVKSGRERRVLKARGCKRGRGGRRWWEETGKLKGVGM